MSDLISRDALMELARNHVNRTVDCNDIARFPTIDAVPVVHARWIDDCTNIVCSVCNAAYSDEIVFMNRNFECEDLKFCPNCGAKMDGEPGV